MVKVMRHWNSYNLQSQVGAAEENIPKEVISSSIQVLVADPSRPNPSMQLNVATVSKM